MNPQGEVAKSTEALPVRLFRLRLEKLLLLLGQNQQDAAVGTIASLQEMISRLPVENINIRPQAEALKALLVKEGDCSGSQRYEMGQIRCFSKSQADRG